MRCRSDVQMWQKMSEPSTFNLAGLAVGDRLETHLEMVLLLVQSLNLDKQVCLFRLTSFQLVLARQVLGCWSAFGHSTIVQLLQRKCEELLRVRFDILKKWPDLWEFLCKLSKVTHPHRVLHHNGLSSNKTIFLGNWVLLQVDFFQQLEMFLLPPFAELVLMVVGQFLMMAVLVRLKLLFFMIQSTISKHVLVILGTEDFPGNLVDQIGMENTILASGSDELLLRLVFISKWLFVRPLVTVVLVLVMVLRLAFL